LEVKPAKSGFWPCSCVGHSKDIPELLKQSKNPGAIRSKSKFCKCKTAAVPVIDHLAEEIDF